jgi:hypothetical protein
VAKNIKDAAEKLRDLQIFIFSIRPFISLSVIYIPVHLPF